MTLACALAACLPALLQETPPAPVTPEIQWRHDYAAAREEAQAQNRVLFIDFWATWCPPCRRMNETTFVDAAVVEYVSANFIPLKIDTDENQPLATEYGVQGIPCFWLVSPEGEKIGNFVGYRDAAQFRTEVEKLRSAFARLPDLRAKAEQEPENSAAIHDLAGALADLGRTEDAKAQHQRVTEILDALEEISAEDAERACSSHEYLAEQAAEGSDAATARAHIEAVLRRSPNNEGGHWMKAQVLLAQILISEEKAGEVAPIVEAGIERYPRDASAPKLLFMAAYAAYTGEDKETALRHLRRIRDEYPDSEEASQARQAIEQLENEEGGGDHD